MGTLRAFIAAEMPGLVGDAVRRSQELLQREGIRLRWVRPENVHLTLRFLGDISASKIPEIREAMEETVCRRGLFSLKISDMGLFPGLKHPKVFWLGLGGELDQLDALYRTLSASLAERGFPRETRPFKAHLTIGRVKGGFDTKKLGAALKDSSLFGADTFVVDSICLFKSDLRPGGAVYTPLVKAEIKG